MSVVCQTGTHAYNTNTIMSFFFKIWVLNFKKFRYELLHRQKVFNSIDYYVNVPKSPILDRDIYLTISSSDTQNQLPTIDNYCDYVVYASTCMGCSAFRHIHLNGPMTKCTMYQYCALCSVIRARPLSVCVVGQLRITGLILFSIQ